MISLLEGAALRRFIIAIIAVAVLAISFGATASADPYKWYAVYGGRGGGPSPV